MVSKDAEAYLADLMRPPDPGRPRLTGSSLVLGVDEVLREKAIVGTPETVTERFRKIAADLELDGILAELNCGGQVPRGGVINSLRLLCDEVMPAFK